MLKKLASFSAIAGAAMMTFVACGPQPMSFGSLESQIVSPTGTVDALNVSSAMKQFQLQNSFVTMNDNVNVAPPPNDIGRTEPMPLTAKRSVKIHASMLPQDAMVQTGVPKLAVKLLRPEFIGLQAAIRTKQTQAPTGVVAKNKKNPMSCIEGENIFQKDADYSIDLSCMESSGSGFMRISTRGISLFALSGSNAPTEVKGEIKVHFDNVCSDGTCINGRIAVKMDIKSDIGTLLSAYNLQATKGSEKKILKGGMRIKNEGNGGASFDVLILFKNNSGQEVSLVLGMKANQQADGGNIYIKGKNGSFVCAAKENGNTGMCRLEKGGKTSEFNWSAN